MRWVRSLLRNSSSLSENFFNCPSPFEDFIPIWNEIFTENQEVSQTILSQKGRRRLGLLSNTNPLHFDYILSKFCIIRAFDQWILSHEMGFKKPAVEIYQKAIDWASVEPRKILFIDDMKKHVEVAMSLGMQGVHFISAEQLREELFVRTAAIKTNKEGSTPKERSK